MHGLISASRPGVTYQEALRKVEQRAEELPFLPGSLPYQVVSVQGEMAFLPDEAKHRVRIALSDAKGALAEVTLPLHQVVGHRAVLSYKPATEADAELVRLSGGLF